MLTTYIIITIIPAIILFYTFVKDIIECPARIRYIEYPEILVIIWLIAIVAIGGNELYLRFFTSKITIVIGG